MCIIEVKNEAVVEREINGKNGRIIVREQRAAILVGDGYAKPFNVGLGSGPVYQVGHYLLHPDSYGENNFGEPALKRPKLWPLTAALKASGVTVPPAIAPTRAA